MAFKERLQAWLDEHPETDQSKLARDLGISASAVNQWLAGGNGPRPHRWDKLSEVLGISVAELMGWLELTHELQPDAVTPVKVPADLHKDVERTALFRAWDALNENQRAALSLIMRDMIMVSDDAKKHAEALVKSSRRRST